MQKSVLVPVEKYQQLLERGATPNNVETRDTGTETDHQTDVEPQTEIKTEEKTAEAPESKETSLAPREPFQVSENLHRSTFETAERPVKKRKRRSRPPGIRNYKSMWIKLNGRL